MFLLTCGAASVALSLCHNQVLQVFKFAVTDTSSE